MKELRRLAPELLAAAAVRLKRDRPNLVITTKALEGMPRALIVREAADWGADLIVHGSHGLGRSGRRCSGPSPQASRRMLLALWNLSGLADRR